jgi:hypothetical protein
MLIEQTELLAGIVVLWAFVLKFMRDPKLSAIPAVVLLLQGVACIAADPAANVWFALGCMVTVWGVQIDVSWRNYLRQKGR